MRVLRQQGVVEMDLNVLDLMITQAVMEAETSVDSVHEQELDLVDPEWEETFLQTMAEELSIPSTRIKEAVIKQKHNIKDKHSASYSPVIAAILIAEEIL